MLRYVDGFDHYNTEALMLLKGWSSGGSILISAGRFGGGCVTLQGNSAEISRGFSAQSTLIIGFAYRPPLLANAIVCTCSLGTAVTLQCELRLTSTGALQITRGGTALTGGTSAAGVITASTWAYVEWKVTISDSIAAGSCRVRVGGVQVIDVATGQDTKAQAGAGADIIRFGPHAQTNALFDYDDLYILDGVDSGVAGMPNNDFLGDCRVETLFPSGAGTTTAWTPSAGANYACVDDPAMNSDADYVGSTTPGAVDTYAMGNLSSAPAAIFGIQTAMAVRKDDAGSRTVAPVVRSGGADYAGTTVSMNDSYQIRTEVREVDPAGAAAWTQASINALEAGTKIVS